MENLLSIMENCEQDKIIYIVRDWSENEMKIHYWGGFRFNHSQSQPN